MASSSNSNPPFQFDFKEMAAIMNTPDFQNTLNQSMQALSQSNGNDPLRAVSDVLSKQMNMNDEEKARMETTMNQLSDNLMNTISGADVSRRAVRSRRRRRGQRGARRFALDDGVKTVACKPPSQQS